jgi:hypothetical protein
MDVEMSAQGAHRMIAEVKEEVRDFSDLFGNLHNQVETMRVEDIAWCRSRISVLEKPNNPANKSLWTLVNLLVRRVDDQADQIKDLKAGLALGGERVSVLEMSSSMIRSRVSVLEEAMEIDPPLRIFLGMMIRRTRSMLAWTMEERCWWMTRRMRGTRRTLSRFRFLLL